MRIKRVMNKNGMEMVQVAILVGIAVVVGLIFKTQITSFVNHIFNDLFANF
ncbi:MAG: Flp1 family type IVb pilin [Anaerovoracaceae bacterium]